VNLGLTHHWTDLGEPEMYDERSCYFGFPEIGKNRHSDIHNVFSLMWLESIARGYERNHVRERPFMMARAAISGVQRTGAGMWSGDIAANMGALTAHLNAQMHMSLSGIDYYGSDVGGFHRRADTLDGDAGELFTQWFANASLFDFPLRSHVWNLANNLQTSPATMGERASNLANAKRRFELHPYVYTLAHRAAERGEPVVYPALLEFPEDSRLRSAGGLKMIGPDLLAAVVARYGELYRDVYLPAGEWFDFESRDAFTSSGEELAQVPARREGAFKLPLFARAGAIVPMARFDGQVSTISGQLRGGGRRHDLRVRVFGASAETRFTLIEDDGHTVDYKSGRVARTEISQAYDAPAGVQRVTIGASAGDYEGKPERRDLAVELVTRDRRATSASLDGTALPACPAAGACFENSARNLVVVRLPQAQASDAHAIEVRLETTTPTVSVFFACHRGQTHPGEAVYVLGSLPELGGGDPARAIKLDPTAYPVWTGQIAGLPVDAGYSWRCIRRPESGTPWVHRGVERTSRTGRSGYSGVQESHFE
jgi:alpha-glucosidase